jgi:hypothetical protein
VKTYAGSDLSTTRSLLIVYVLRSYDPGRKDYVIRTSPSITCGLPHVGGAVSVVSYAEKDGVSESEADTTWALITEYGRQLSITHLASGRGDSRPSLLQSPGSDFSLVTWDSPADTLRAMGKQAWLSNRFGFFKLTRDEDEDGIPDDEPACPFDEKRFSSNPRAKDTDGDGVMDGDEVLMSRWAGGFPIATLLADGTLEKVRGMAGLVAPKPSAVDMDEDGIRDLEDVNPLCPLGDSIPKREIRVDGELSAEEWEAVPSLSISDPEYNGLLRVAWSETQFCFSLAGGDSHAPPSIRIRIDAASDGYARGSDNIGFLLEPLSDGAFEVRPQAAGSGLLPGVPPSVSELPAITAAWRKTEGKDQFEIEVGLTKSSAWGLNLFGGKEVAFDVELRPAKSTVWLRAFEPLLLFRGTLAEAEE